MRWRDGGRLAAYRLGGGLVVPDFGYGYEILYFPIVSVIHRRSPRGRAAEERVWRETIGARIVTSVRCLPWRHVVVNT
jgi:hypothetical protein